MSAYRTSGYCESCNVLREELEKLKNPKDEVEFFPFQSREKTTCPFCNKDLRYPALHETIVFCQEKRKHVVKKRWFRADKIEIENEDCLQVPHFHKQCFICGGEWTELSHTETKKLKNVK